MKSLQRLLVTNRRPGSQPGNIGIVRRSVVVLVVIGRVSRNRPLVRPSVGIRMTIGKGYDAAAIMRAVWKIEKGVARHVNAKIWPANAIGINVYKRERPCR